MFQRERSLSKPLVFTLFDRHLQDIYNSPVPIDGGVFFESAGYYDQFDGNTVQAFMDYSGLSSFWGNESVTSSAVTEDDLLEEEEANSELIEEEMQLQVAVLKIRKETDKFQSSFFQAFNDTNVQVVERIRQSQTNSQNRARPNQPPLSNSLTLTQIHLPPYTGNLLVLKSKTVSFFISSWHKRWFCLNFEKGELCLYRRSFWKSPKGKMDMRAVSRIYPINKTDFQMEFHGGFSMLSRAKSIEEMELWIKLLLFARRQAHAISLTLIDNKNIFGRSSEPGIAWLERQTIESTKCQPRAA